MKRQQAPKEAAGIALFPFLAVLLCTMGALLVLLVAIARHSRDVAVRGARSVAQIDADFTKSREELERELDELRASRDKSRAQLGEARNDLSHLEDHTRRLRDELEAARKTVEDIQRSENSDESTLKKLRDRIARYEEDIRAMAEDVEAARREARGRKDSYAIIPYDGPNQTRRRPIYIECRSDAIVIQPENIVLDELDFMGPAGPSNPLAACLRAGREYMLRNVNHAQGEDGEPYPLLLVRPDGIAAYYMAREAMVGWGSDFGYELIEQDWKLKFQPANLALAAHLTRAVDEARKRQEMLVSAAPRLMTPEERLAYRNALAARTGGGGSNSGSTASGGTGALGGRGGGGLRSGDSRFASEDERKAASSAKALAPYAGLDLAGTGGGGANAGAQSMGGPGSGAPGSPQRGGIGYGPGPGVGAPGTGTPGMGMAGTTGGMQNGAEVVPPGVAQPVYGMGLASAQTGSGQPGTGAWGSGNAWGGNGQPGATSNNGTAGNAPGSQGVGGAPGGTLAGGGTSPVAGTGVGTPGAGQAPAGQGGTSGGAQQGPSLGSPGSPGGQSSSSGGASGMAGASGASSPSAGGGDSSSLGGGPQGAASAGGLSLTLPGAAQQGGSTPTSSDAAAAQAAEQARGGPRNPFETTGQTYAQPKPAGTSSASAPPQGPMSAGQQSYSGPSSAAHGSQPPGSQLSQEQREQIARGAKGKHRNWAIREDTRAAVPITRPIQVECSGNRITIISERGDVLRSQAIDMKGPTNEALEPLVAAVWERVNSWGIAGTGMYWRPVLVVNIAPDGRSRYDDLAGLLNNSGLEVREKSNRPHAAQSPQPPRQR
jgi:hypothetical protein